jgi:hypothetical protein
MPVTQARPKSALSRPVAEKSLAAPLVFDLDGTLIATDLLVEALLFYLKRNPLRILVVVSWLRGGSRQLEAQAR